MMPPSSPRPPASQRSFQSLVVSILLLLVLVADPRLFIEHLPHAHDVVLNVLLGLRLWLVCLAVCYVINRLLEMVLQRRIRGAWIYILLWSAIIPPLYGFVARQIEGRWPAAENDMLLLIAMALVTAFAGAMLKRLADSVTRTAQYDHLTGLPNRILLNDRLSRGIARAQRLDKKLAVCMINIDRFKRINDSLGHAGGDALLVHVAKQLQAVVVASDTVARIGGDEFVVLIPDFDSLQQIEKTTQRILNAISVPIKLGDREVCVTASLGYCVYPDGANAAASLLHSADAAMYDIKSAGRASLHVYTPPVHRPTTDRLEMEEDFRHALQNNELTLHYQPQIQLATREVTGLEALLRWNSPKRGSIPPSQFIPIAEEVGLMVPVGEWALKQCCQDGVELQKLIDRRLTIALNLSARQFSQRGLPTLIEKTLLETGLNPTQLELEITEQMLMVNSPYTLETLQAIRDLGVGIAIDDFGTGFSSFAYILQYHVDRIKIDQSFIARSIQDPNAMAVVRTIIAMAHGLNMRVVAEGVETHDQSDFLMRRRCDDAQGYLYARPVAKNEVFATIQRIEAELRQRLPAEALPLSEFDVPLETPVFLRN
ncbi:MAG TPA: EAL domain-containing protein [Acidobacteriaceae bacterium]|nr:EAL domain-containing protein [Acidobacteriaceae bacterium]